MVSLKIQKLAEEWLRLDKDPVTRDEIYHLLVKNDEDELTSRLSTRIAFGTAGLRAKMEAGFARMNSLTVIQASQGLAEYLLATQSEVKHRGVVIGRDARHNSEKFAKLAAAAFVERGTPIP
jgi:phosphoglucomutase